MSQTIQTQLPANLLKLDVTTYGTIEKVNDVLSKCRVRIFYKGMNRNRTFITEDFANQLIQSLPYTPIKGIFDYAQEDYEDHGNDNSDGRIYGIVPESPNFSWEKHLDNDEVEREYACCDVYLFTSLYSEAKLIPTKSQSMEIYRNTLKGEWRISPDDGQPYYHFLKGSLLGLQVLGDTTEPCFEGSAFYSLCKGANELLDYIKNFSKKEEKKMEINKELFRLSDNEKWDCIFDALNPNFNEEGAWKLDYSILDIYDDYALCYSGESGKYSRVYYTKENDSVTIGEKVDVYIVDVTETEYNALEAMKSIGTYEAVNEKITEMTTAAETYAAEKTEFESTIVDKDTKIAEMESTISTYSTEKADLEAKISEKENEISTFSAEIEALKSEKSVLETEKTDIITERDSLAEFKKTIENEKKEAILSEFSIHLNDEQIKSFKESFDKYSVEDFEKEVCTTAYKSDSTMFSKKSSEPDYIYKNDSQTSKSNTGMMRLLENYKNGGNK